MKYNEVFCLLGLIVGITSEGVELALGKTISFENAVETVNVILLQYWSQQKEKQIFF